MTAAPQKRLRRFVFTLPNYTPEELDSICTFQCRWIIVAKEIAPGTGTPHLQGACVIGKQINFNTLKEHPGFKRAHIEVMRGTPQQSLEYCTKEDKQPFQRGILPTPGRRNDIHAVTDLIREGQTLQQIAKNEEHAPVIVKYFKGLMQYRDLVTPLQRIPRIVIWIHGATGLGKTQRAVEFGEYVQSFWISHGDLQWFNGYDGQRVAILDDLRRRHAKFDYLLRLLDIYPLQVPIKGSYVNWNPQVIIITAPYSPAEMWSFRTNEDIKQLERRITKIIPTPEEDFDLKLICADVRPPSPEEEKTIEEIIIPDTQPINIEKEIAEEALLLEELDADSCEEEKHADHDFSISEDSEGDEELLSEEDQSGLSEESLEYYVNKKIRRKQQMKKPVLKKQRKFLDLTQV